MMRRVRAGSRSRSLLVRRAHEVRKERSLIILPSSLPASSRGEPHGLPLRPPSKARGRHRQPRQAVTAHRVPTCSENGHDNGTDPLSVGTDDGTHARGACQGVADRVYGVDQGLLDDSAESCGKFMPDRELV